MSSACASWSRATIFSKQVVGAILGVRSELMRASRWLHRMVLAAVQADPVCRRLMTVPGVGPLTALAFRTAVEDPTRFTNGVSWSGRISA